MALPSDCHYHDALTSRLEAGDCIVQRGHIDAEFLHGSQIAYHHVLISNLGIGAPPRQIVAITGNGDDQFTITGRHPNRLRQGVGAAGGYCSCQGE